MPIPTIEEADTSEVSSTKKGSIKNHKSYKKPERMPKIPLGRDVGVTKPKIDTSVTGKRARFVLLPILAGALMVNACASTPRNSNKTLIAAKAAYQTANSLHDELCKTPTPGVSVPTCHKAFVLLKADYVVIENSAKLLRQYEISKDKVVLSQLAAGLPQVQATVAELVQLVQDLKNGK